MPGTVTVACKLPAGLHLTVFRMEQAMEPLLGGGSREVKRAVKAGRVTVRGTEYRQDDRVMASGIALTYGVDADLWTAWLEQNADADVVKNGLIFASAKTPDVHAQARDIRDEKNGLERLDPHDLPKEFRGKIERAQAPS